MEKKDLKNILEQIKEVRIGIVGDFCLDAYWYVDESKSEISVETGKRTVTVRDQKYSLGGAGNVANNLTAMCVKDVRAFGVIGSDPFAVEMVGLMKKNGIRTNNLLIQEDQWSTHVYIKPYNGEEEQSRIDFGNFNVLSEQTANLLIDMLKNEIEDLDIFIINQQVLSGIHTPYFRTRLVELIRLYPEKKFIADSRNYMDEYAGSYRKMNDYEAALLSVYKKVSSDVVLYEEVIQSAQDLYKEIKKAIFIPRGGRG